MIRPDLWQRPLVVGGHGFIGGHIVERLTTLPGEGRVFVVDPARPAWKLRTGKRKVAHVRERIEDVVELSLTFRRVTSVIHLGAPVGPAGILKGPGVAGPMLTAQLAAQRVAEELQVPLVTFSSSEVFGTADSYGESDDAVWPPERATARAGYGIGKLACEVLAAEHHRANLGLPTLVVRPFNTAGYGQDYGKGFVLARFAMQAVVGEKLTVFGGTQRRSFCDVRDMARFVVDDAPEAPQLWDAVPLNVGNPLNRTSIGDLAKLVQKLAGVKGTVEQTSGREVHGDQFRESPAETKVATKGRAHRAGWRPDYDLADVVRQALQYAREREG